MNAALAAAILGQVARRDNQPTWRQCPEMNVDSMTMTTYLHCRVASVTVHAARSTAVNHGGLQKDVPHFRIFLVLEIGGSVELDSTGRQMLTTQLNVTFRPYRHSVTPRFLAFENTTSQVSFTVNDVLDLLARKNRHRYRLERDSGSGCRFWCSTVLRDFIEIGWLPQGSDMMTTSVANYIRAQYGPDELYVPQHNIQGDFY